MEIQIHPTEFSEGESGSDEEVTEPIVDPMEIQSHPTEMSQGENGSVEEATVPIVDRVEIQIHPTERSQGENGSNEEALHQCLTSTIVQNIGEGVQKTESFSSASIYRVPEYIRKHKESAYTPCLIAIGPLHRKDKHLQTPLQHVKMSYTNHLLSRLTEQTMFTVVQECLAEMKTLVDEAKKYYAEEVTLDEKMMLIDGCFILEFLYRYLTLKKEPLKAAEAAEAEAVKDEGPKKDPIRVGNTLKKVKSDLVLLENQIPFNVLEKLFHLTVGRISDRPNKDWSLTNYVRWCYADEMMPERNSNSRGYIKSTLGSSSDCVLGVFGKNIDHHGSTAKYYHILHYLHDGYLQPLDKANQINFDFTEMPSASELVNAGVKFAPDTGNDLFKFKFSEPLCHIRARFEIPPLPIYEETESYLRNLIAFEQCCPGILLHVSSYAFVMDLLVDDKKDIQVLEEAGVLRNYLGTTKEAADLFNKLCNEIAHDEYFADTCSKATKYSKQFWPKNVALARRTYFASPLTFTAYCFGFIYFITSFLDFLNGPT